MSSVSLGPEELDLKIIFDLGKPDRLMDREIDMIDMFPAATKDNVLDRYATTKCEVPVKVVLEEVPVETPVVVTDNVVDVVDDDVDVEVTTEQVGELNGLLVSKGSSDTKFKVNNQMVFLTYARCEFERNEYIAWMTGEERGRARCPSGTKVYVAHEHHEDGCSHMHVAINFTRPVQKAASFFTWVPKSQSRFGGAKNGGPRTADIKNVARGDNGGAWAKIVTYMRKEDKTSFSEMTGMAASATLAILNSSNAVEAYMNAPHLGVLHAIKLYDSAVKEGNMMPNDPTPAPTEPWFEVVKTLIMCQNKPTHPWKTHFRGEEFLNSVVNVPIAGSVHKIDYYRSIHVFMDKKGCSGKSKAINWLRENGNISEWARGHDVCAISPKDAKHFAQTLSTIVKDGWNGCCMLVNMPRATSGKLKGTELYSMLEEVADGRVTCSMYESPILNIYRKCIIVLFCNEWPNLSAMTRDRWCLWRINEDGSFTREDQDEIEKSSEYNEEIETVSENRARSRFGGWRTQQAASQQSDDSMGGGAVFNSPWDGY